MVELTQKTINAINAINNALKETEFYINRFEVSTNGLNEITLDLDIREKNEKA